MEVLAVATSFIESLAEIDEMYVQSSHDNAAG